MPRAVDRFELPIDHDPNRDASEVAVQRFMLDNQTVFQAVWEQIITYLNDTVLGWIKDTFGLDLTIWVEYLAGLFGISTDGDPPTLDEAVRSFIEGFLKPLGEWLSPDDALNASRIFGQPPSGIFNRVPWGALTAEAANLLDNPGFNSGLSIGPNSEWTWDARVYYAEIDDGDEPGSVRVTADGTRKRLHSNATTVAPGQVLNYRVQVLSHDLKGAGNPVQLWVQTEQGEQHLTGEFPRGGNAGWYGGPTETYGATLSAEYTVPDEGVEWVSMMLVVDEQAQQGTLWWDAAISEMSRGFIGDAIQLLNDVGTLVETFFAYLFGDATREQLLVAWNNVLDGLGIEHPPDMSQFWDVFFDRFAGPFKLLVSKEFWKHVGYLIDTVFQFILGNASANEVVAAWDAVLADFEASRPDSETFWQAVCTILFLPFTSYEFCNALGTLVDLLFAYLLGNSVSRNAIDAAWDNALEQAETIRGESLWKWALRAIKLIADIARLVDYFFRWVLGKGTSWGEVTAQFDRVLDDLRVPDGRDMSLTATIERIIQDFFPMIPSDILGGDRGSTGLLDTFDNMWSGFLSAFGLKPVLGGNFNQVAGEAYEVSASALQAKEWSSSSRQLLAVRDNKPLYLGVSDTAEPAFPFGEADGTYSVGSNTAPVTFIRVESPSNKGRMSLLAQQTSSSKRVSGLYMMFGKLDRDAKKIRWLHTSDNLGEQVGSDWRWIVAPLPSYQLIEVKGDPSGKYTITGDKGERKVSVDATTTTVRTAFRNATGARGAKVTGTKGKQYKIEIPADQYVDLIDIDDDDLEGEFGSGVTAKWDEFQPGDEIAIALVVTGSHNVRTWSYGSSAPSHPDATIPAITGKWKSPSRNRSTLDLSGLQNWTNDKAPWVSTDVAVDGKIIYPDLVDSNESGTKTITLPNWVSKGDIIELVGVGGGGGGGSSLKAGNKGRNTKLSIMRGNTTVASRTASGGNGGGKGLDNSNSGKGFGPSSKRFQKVNYYGGNNVGYKKDGDPPGGGGGGAEFLGALGGIAHGGKAGSWGTRRYICKGNETKVRISVGNGGDGASGSNAGDGAKGKGWIRVRQKQ